MSLLWLFLTFFYIGALTVGGGLVAITFMQQALIPTGLIDLERFYAMVAVSQSTPGPIGVNMSTYLGYEFYGIVGGIVLTLAIILPTFIKVLIIVQFARRFQNNTIVKRSFYGLRAAASGMIAVAAWQIIVVAVGTLPHFRQTGNLLHLIDWKALALFSVLFALAILLKKFHPVVIIALGGIAGFFLF